MKIANCILAVLILSVAAVAENTPSSQPDPQAEILALRREIADLKRANESLRAANEALRKKVEGGKTVASGATQRAPYRGSTFSKRAEQYVKGHRLAAGDRASTLASGARIDKAIAEYVKKNNLDTDAESQLYRGQVKIGMTEEALRIIGSLEVERETARSKTVRYSVWQPAPDAPTLTLTISDGKVSVIDHASDSNGGAVEVHPGRIPR